jgi:hypothetical protein
MSELINPIDGNHKISSPLKKNKKGNAPYLRSLKNIKRKVWR